MMSNQTLREKAWSYHKNNQLEDAEKIYIELIKEERNEKDISNLGALLRVRGRYKEALELYKEWWGKCEITLNLGINAINAGIEAEDMLQTRAWLDETLNIYPNDVRLQIAKAKLYSLNGDKLLAVETLKLIAENNPQNINAWLELGKSQSNSDQKRNAIESFKKAKEIDRTDARVIANLITTLEEVGLTEENNNYIDSIKEATKNLTIIKGARAYTYILRGQMYEAELLYRELCMDSPMEPIYWLNRCACKRELKESHAALRIAKRGIKYNPKNENLRHAMSQCYAELGNPKLATYLMNEEISGLKQISEENLFNLQFIGEGYKTINTDTLQVMAQKWEANKIKGGVSPIHLERIEEENKKRRRIAYMSGDFCNHPVGRYIKPIINCHNHEKFEIVGIDCGSRDDNIKHEIKNMCDIWISIDKISDFEAARLIGDKSIDILVELGGYTSKSRLGVLCYKPAKVQLSYLGYFGPTYLKTIDGWIGDEEIFGSLDNIQKRAHRLHFVKGGYMAYEEDEPPNIREIQRKNYRFGTFNHSRKLSRKTIDLFSRILNEIPDSEIIIKSINFIEKEEQARIMELLSNKGINKKRIKTLNYVDGRENHLKLYNEIDIALDPTPYGGATTTCEALIMGIPVVTYAGKGMAGRLSTSILKYSGCDEWIAYSDNEYIEICKKMARKGIRNSNERYKLRKKILESKLCDNIRVTEELEKIYIDSLYMCENEDSR